MRQTRLSFQQRKRPQRTLSSTKPAATLSTATASAASNKSKPNTHKKPRKLTPAEQRVQQEERERSKQRAAEREKERAERERLRLEQEAQQQQAVREHGQLIGRAFDLERLDGMLAQLVEEGDGVSDSDDEMADGGEEQQHEEHPQPASPLPPLLLPSPTSSSVSSIASEDSSSSATLSPASTQLDSDDEPPSNELTDSASSCLSTTSASLSCSSHSLPFHLDFDLSLDWPHVVQRDLFYKLAYTPLPLASPFSLPAEYDADRKQHCADTEPNFTLIARNEWKRRKPNLKRDKADKDDAEDMVVRCKCHLKRADEQAEERDEKAEGREGEEADSRTYDCREGCINATLFVECDENNCELSSLQASERCNNRAFQRHSSGLTAPVEKCWYDVKGWGLRATADMAAGAFVIEYTGEVINNKECKRRIDKEDRRAEQAKRRARLAVQHTQHSQRSHHKKNKGASMPAAEREEASGAEVADDGAPRSNYYFMALVDDVILDASSKGSIARFINHSCDANCLIQKWTVGDELRIGIFTQRKIRQGEELTIDYKYDRIGLHYQPCYCQSHNCAQWIGAKPTNGGTADSKQRVKLSKNDKRKADTAARARAALNADEVCGACGVGGDLLLCDQKLPTGHYCPRAHHHDCAGVERPAEGAEVEGEIVCAWHICDRAQPAACKRRAQLYCVCCSSSRCRECHAADEGWAVAWRESQLCQKRVMRLDVRDWLCAQVEGRDELWVVCTDCQEQPRVLMRAELAIWKAITGQAGEEEEAHDDGGGEQLQATGMQVEHGGEEESEQEEVEDAQMLASEEADIRS